MKKTLTLTALSEHIDIPKRTLFDMLKDGRFPVEPLKGIKPRRWSTEQVDEWLKNNEQ